ncbi:PAH-inducible cytochrome P450 monooxygenase PC-PAH 1 [Cylindrobasidium torrendii FP15055 ss-10]|uniref:PAH-inducible cytochrome P450 monooxygenase PC-PAH 1 n=1 Tax=Cylindrobasidium torrendii FP15055 ss-10 TaxID=1314674 RepID=A0A0D7BNW3_9AGAR|nr:PAH-inducible cytochrome P450 monooxygenase PC-PAH 1 [Cylindrobasidium torrendii FP15055 ss-10]
MSTHIYFGGFAALAIALATYFIFTGRSSLPSYIPGPPSPSWIAGNAVQIVNEQEKAGDLEFSWFKRYGATIKIKGTFGTDILMTSDAKALQYILLTSAYRFYKAPELCIALDAMGGPGISTVNGADHARQRKVVNMSFSETQLLYQSIKTSGNVVNMDLWFGRAALDALGKAAFSYDFNALTDPENSEMGHILHHFHDSTPSTSRRLRVGLWALEKIPPLRNLLAYFPGEVHKRFRHFQDACMKFSLPLIDEAKKMVDDSTKDMLSVIVGANQSENPNRRMSDEELICQAPHILTAGQGSTTSTLAWTFYYLSHDPETQEALRQEINEVIKRVGPEEPFSVHDYDGMALLNAVVKEALRLHPILAAIPRQAEFDEIIPLSEPIITENGEKIYQIPVKKGQHIQCAAHGYNRNPVIWGPDAQEWNPKRWLNKPDMQYSVGVYGNTLSFGGGVRNCIGWRFAVMEMQCLTTEMVKKFRYEPSVDTKKVLPWPGFITTPRMKGRFHEGPQMPLIVTPI